MAGEHIPSPHQCSKARVAHKCGEKLGFPEKPEEHMSNVCRHAGMNKPQVIKIDTQAKEKQQKLYTKAREPHDLDNAYHPIYIQHTLKHINLLIRLGIVSCCLPGAWLPSEPIGQMDMRFPGRDSLQASGLTMALWSRKFCTGRP